MSDEATLHHCLFIGTQTLSTTPLEHRRAYLESLELRLRLLASASEDGPALFTKLIKPQLLLLWRDIKGDS